MIKNTGHKECSTRMRQTRRVLYAYENRNQIKIKISHPYCIVSFAQCFISKKRRCSGSRGVAPTARTGPKRSGVLRSKHGFLGHVLRSALDARLRSRATPHAPEYLEHSGAGADFAEFSSPRGLRTTRSCAAPSAPSALFQVHPGVVQNLHGRRPQDPHTLVCSSHPAYLALVAHTPTLLNATMRTPVASPPASGNSLVRRS
jgi:hypothetical protein